MTKLEELSKALEELQQEAKQQQEAVKVSLNEAIEEMQPHLLDLCGVADEWARSLQRPQFIELRDDNKQGQDTTMVFLPIDKISEIEIHEGGVIVWVYGVESSLRWAGTLDELLDTVGCLRPAPKPVDEEEPDSGDLIG